jgi:hypothetical protein
MTVKKKIKHTGCNWNFQGNGITNKEQMPKETFGFVYQITIELDNKEFHYIGQKRLISRRKKMMTKKEIEALPNKRLKKYYYVETEMPWQSYLGSNKVLLALVKQYGEKKLKLRKEIIEYCFSELELKWRELKKIVCDGAMESTEYFNDNISIKQIGTFDFSAKKEIAK